MEEKVLDIILSKNKAMTYDEIAESLSDKEIPSLTEVLNKLEKELKIRVTNKGKYEKFNVKKTLNNRLQNFWLMV